MARCKRCGIKILLSDDEINQMVDDVRKMKGVHTAEENVYKHRLEVCGRCESLEYGSTCMKCGCIVNVRAVMKDGKCPKGKWTL